MTGRIFLLFSFVFISQFSVAQKEDRNWVFGDSIRIDFNNLSNPTVHDANCYNGESNASISKRNGGVLMYLNTQDFFLGEFRYCQLMNGQNDLIAGGDSVYHYFSATNGALFIPMPGDSLKYYFFSIGRLVPNNLFLSYSIIDVSLNGGLGMVISKNNLLNDSLTEHLLAIRHGNGRDWWLLSKKKDTNTTIEYLITPSGISFSGVFNLGSIFYKEIGECAASNDGSKIGFVSLYKNLDVFDFDRCTGEMINYLELGIPPYNQVDPTGWTYYGCEFSSDNSKMYICQVKTNPATVNIFQFTLDASSPQNSKTDVLPPIVNYGLQQMEMGPDEKIYIGGAPGPGILDSSYKFLSVINNPNDSSTACNLDLFSLYLNGHKALIGLPNIPHYNLSALDDSPCDTLGLGVNGVEPTIYSIFNIFPNPATDELTIEILNGIAPKQFEITNSIGVTVLQLKQTKPNQQVNIKSLAHGIYFVKVYMNDGCVEVRKFVKE